MSGTRDDEKARQGDMAPEDQRWFDSGGDDPERTDPPNRNEARDEGRSIEDEAAILADNLIGQKATTEGTAGKSGTEPPRGQGARDGDEDARRTSR